MDAAYLTCFASAIRNGLGDRIPLLQGIFDDLQGHADGGEGALPAVVAVAQAYRRLQLKQAALAEQTTPLKREQTDVPELNDIAGLGNKGAQQRLTALVEGLRFTKLFTKADGDDRKQKCWLSCTGPYSSPYHAVPGWQGFKISEFAFRCRIRMTLDLPLVGAKLMPATCACCGRDDIDDRGYHLLFCNHTKGNLLRHNLLKELLHKIIKNCGDESAQMETQFTDTDRRRLDIEMRNFSAGATAHHGIDVTVVSPLHAGNPRLAGKAASKGEAMKAGKYQAHHLPAGMTFVPCVVETFGRLGDSFVELLRELADMAHSIRGWPQWFFWQKWAPKIGACLAEGNFAKVTQIRSANANERLRVQRQAANGADTGDAGYDLGGPASWSSRTPTRRMPRVWQRPALRPRRRDNMHERFRASTARALQEIAEGRYGETGPLAFRNRRRQSASARSRKNAGRRRQRARGDRSRRAAKAEPRRRSASLWVLPTTALPAAADHRRGAGGSGDRGGQGRAARGRA